MKARIAQIVGESEAKNLWMGTFHSVFARILRAEADRLGHLRVLLFTTPKILNACYHPLSKS